MTMTAKALYQLLSTDRQGPLNRARDCAALTIPSLIPPEGHSTANEIPEPFQSIGARGLNNLSAKVHLALFPAGNPFFRTTVPNALAKEAGSGGIAEVETALAERDAEALRLFESSPIRPMLGEAITLEVATGQVLVFFKDMETFRVFRLDQFVIRRDGMGNPLEAVVCETVAPITLDPEILAAAEIDPTRREDVELYTKVWWKKGRVYYKQELNDKDVPGSHGEAPSAVSPWFAPRWRAVPNSHYARGHVEEYLGSLRSLEGITQGIVEFAAVAAKIVLLVHPNAVTNVADINNAESGEAVSGTKADVDVLQLDKYADFQVCNTMAERFERMLSEAFLLRGGVTRNAERVTAEEIRATAAELEDSIANAYTFQVNELQLPFVRRLLFVLERANKIARLPQGATVPLLVAGFQALGRNHALNRLRGFVGDIVGTLGPEAAVRILKTSELAKRFGNGWGVDDLNGLLKTEDEMAAEDAKATEEGMTADLMSKAVGPAIAAASKSGQATA